MALSFLVQEAFRGLLRSKRLNLLSLGAMSMSLMALGLVLLLNFGILQVTHFVQDKIEVVVFLNDQAAEPEIESFITKIRDYPLVAGVEYLSKARALEEFSGDETLREFLEVLGSNPLPASLRIGLMEKTPANVNRFVTWLKQFAGVGEVSYGGGDADRVLKALQFVRLCVMILTASLVLSAIIIIANIISLMVFARREEIGIMRIIGASNGFIRGPFLIWGIFQGAVGGLVAAGLLYIIWLVLRYYSLHELGLNLDALLPADAGLQALRGMAGLMLVGCFLGLVGSLVSVGRQLNE